MKNNHNYSWSKKNVGLPLCILALPLNYHLPQGGKSTLIGGQCPTYIFTQREPPEGIFEGHFVYWINKEQDVTDLSTKDCKQIKWFFCGGWPRWKHAILICGVGRICVCTSIVSIMEGVCLSVKLSRLIITPKFRIEAEIHQICNYRLPQFTLCRHFAFQNILHYATLSNNNNLCSSTKFATWKSCKEQKEWSGIHDHQVYSVVINRSCSWSVQFHLVSSFNVILLFLRVSLNQPSKIKDQRSKITKPNPS